MITAAQLKQIQTLLNKRFFDREERLDFLSAFFGIEIKSTKDLTKLQAVQLIQALKNEPITENISFSLFDKNNAQHRTILSRCYELGWVDTTDSGKIIPDLDRLGGFLISKYSPVKKALSQMNKTELSKIIGALKKMQK